MKLSEQSVQEHAIGDFGKALEEYADRTRVLEEAIRASTASLLMAVQRMNKAIENS